MQRTNEANMLQWQARKRIARVVSVAISVVFALGCGDPNAPTDPLGTGGVPQAGGAGGAAGMGGVGGRLDPPPACGDGVVALDEECDDANTERGDGCHECVQEHACIVAHGSGRPATFDSARIDPDLNVIRNVALTLPAGYDDDEPRDYRDEAFGRMASCGGAHAYALLKDAERLVHLSFDAQGAPTLEESIDVPNAEAVVCAPAHGTLYVAAASQGGVLDVHAFAVDADGSLQSTDSVSVTLFSALNFSLVEARLATHPATGSLWITGYFTNVFAGTDHSMTARIEADGTGALTLAEPVADIGAGQSARSFRFSEDGRFLVATGVDEDCTVLWRVGETDTLPTLEDQQRGCGYLWNAGDVAWFRDTDRFHYILLEELSVGWLGPNGGLMSAVGAIAPTRAFFLESLYDSTVLVSVSPTSGRLTPFEIGANPADVQADRATKIADRGVRSIAKVPCIP